MRRTLHTPPGSGRTSSQSRTVFTHHNLFIINCVVCMALKILCAWKGGERGEGRGRRLSKCSEIFDAVVKWAVHKLAIWQWHWQRQSKSLKFITSNSYFIYDSRSHCVRYSTHRKSMESSIFFLLAIGECALAPPTSRHSKGKYILLAQSVLESHFLLSNSVHRPFVGTAHSFIIRIQ